MQRCDAEGAQRSKTAPHGQHLRGCSGTAHFCEAAELATCKELGIQVALLQRLKQLIIRARSCAAGAVIELAQYAAEAGL